MKKIRVIVAGTRTFKNYKLLEKTLDFLLQNYKHQDIEIVSGGAWGADFWGEHYATEKGIQKKVFNADWNQFGKAAGPIRNAKMADYGTHCVVFWDGVSRGSANMINVAKAAGLKVKVVRY